MAQASLKLTVKHNRESLNIGNAYNPRTVRLQRRGGAGPGAGAQDAQDGHQ